MVQKNHAIYQNNEYTSLEKKQMEPVEPVLTKIIYQSNLSNIFQSNTYRKDLWFGDTSNFFMKL